MESHYLKIYFINNFSSTTFYKDSVGANVMLVAKIFIEIFHVSVFFEFSKIPYYRLICGPNLKTKLYSATS